MTSVDGLHEGYVVSDRFRLQKILGRGGMGSVWVAQHLSLHIDVAVKFIDGRLAGREDLRSRFAQEARTAARIQSPHVVHILDYGFDGDRPFIAMELLHGETLRSRLVREGRLPRGDVATIVSQAAKGLSRAHALGIVHRDLKPDNLFLCKDDDGALHLKILDFGIARDEGPIGAAPHRTGTGQLLGTPAYMSPEQALARSQVDFRSDLYSLAVVAFHCLTGRLPFETEALGDLVVALTTSEPPVPSSVAAGLTAGIDSWFQCAFRKEPAARFASAKEMADTFALACLDAAGAYDATVLAPPGPTPGAARPSAPERTRVMTGIVAPGALQAPTLADTPVRVAGAAPDTFIGQYASQAGRPRVARGGPPAVVLALAGVVVAVGLAGVGLVAARSRQAPDAGPAAATVLAPAATVSAAPSSPPSASAPAPEAPPALSASASPPPAPSPPRTAPPRRGGSPKTAPVSTSATKPAPTNDYGL
jgi:serine/threonine-protein kinase